MCVFRSVGASRFLVCAKAFFARLCFVMRFCFYEASPSDVLLVLFFSLCFVSGEIFEHQSIFLIETFQKDEDDNEYERAWRQSGRRKKKIHAPDDRS
jgi:hypothetical protein